MHAAWAGSTPTATTSESRGQGQLHCCGLAAGRLGARGGPASNAGRCTAGSERAPHLRALPLGWLCADPRPLLSS